MSVLVPDSGVIIGGRSGLADINIGLGAEGADESWACGIREFSVESQVEQIDSTTFCNEANPSDLAGYERLMIDITGFLRYGIHATGPLIPCPQNVHLLLQYYTGCTISATVNFSRARATRTAGQNSVLTGSARSQGAFVVAWDRTSAEAP